MDVAFAVVSTATDDDDAAADDDEDDDYVDDDDGGNAGISASTKDDPHTNLIWKRILSTNVRVTNETTQFRNLHRYKQTWHHASLKHSRQYGFIYINYWLFPSLRVSVRASIQNGLFQRTARSRYRPDAADIVITGILSALAGMARW